MTSTSPPLSDDEARLLREAGAAGLNDDAIEPAARAEPPGIADQDLRLVAEAYSPAEAGARLGIATDGLGRRVAERSLRAVEDPDGRTLPAFQFDPSGELPGLGKVLAAIDPSVHPGTVARFFLTPTIDLESPAANGPLSPRDWLLASLPVDDVVLLARDL